MFEMFQGFEMFERLFPENKFAHWKLLIIENLFFSICVIREIRG